MIAYRQIKHRFVTDIPEQLDSGTLYISMHYATAVHLCCCGCGREVVTPLSPAQWRITFDGESVSLHPSVGNWNIPCRSHYIISKSKVIEAPTWSDEDVAAGQERDKRARMDYYQPTSEPAFKFTAAASEKQRKGWAAALRDFFVRKR